MLFHVAEQRNKEQINDSAERSDFPRRLHFVSSAGQSRIMRDQVNGCTFFGSFLYASKEMNISYK